LRLLQESLRTGGEKGDKWCVPAVERQERVLEAAAPAESEVNRSIEVIAMVRQIDSGGLRKHLSEEGSAVRAEDVREKSFELDFNVDEVGKTLPAEISLRLDSPDFEPVTQTKKLRVPAYADSMPCTFLIKARIVGQLVANLELLKGEEVVVSRPIRTRAVPEGRTVSQAKNIVSIPLVIVIQSPSAVDVLSSSSGPDSGEQQSREAQLQEMIQQAKQHEEQARYEKDVGTSCGYCDFERNPLQLPAEAPAPEVKLVKPSVASRSPFEPKLEPRTPVVSPPSVERPQVVPVPIPPQPERRRPTLAPRLNVAAGLIGFAMIAAVWLGMRSRTSNTAPPMVKMTPQHQTPRMDPLEAQQQQALDAANMKIASGDLDGAIQELQQGAQLSGPLTSDIQKKLAEIEESKNNATVRQTRHQELADLNKPAPPPPTTAPSPAEIVAADNKAIRAAVQNYFNAFQQKNADGLKQVWPTMPHKTYEKYKNAFGLLSSMTITVLNEEVKRSSDGSTARVSVQSEQYEVPKDDKKPETRSTSWTFQLSKKGGVWRITDVFMANY
jgi:hypothetical protein